MRHAAFALALLATPAASQDLIVQFADTAPNPMISFHSAECEISNAIVMLDLDGSQGGYHFDGARDAKSFEPVEITHGYGALSPVRNGDTRLQLLVRSLGVGDTLDLQAALSDAGAGRADGSGIAGASVRVALSDRVVSGVFDTTGTATLALPKDAKFCLTAAE